MANEANFVQAHKLLEGNEKRLRERFNKRWKNIKKKTEKIDRLKLPNEEELWEKVLEKYRNDWTCVYCGQKLKIKDSEYPYYRSFSIDHEESVDLGGTNDLSNIAICCHRCNIVKSTMRAETFQKMLNLNEPLKENDTLLNQMLYEQFRGKMANKIEREESR